MRECLRACSRCRPSKLKCVKDAEPCKRWRKSKYENDFSVMGTQPNTHPRPLKARLLKRDKTPLRQFEHGKFRRQHQSQQAQAHTLDNHRQPSTIYNNPVQSWQEKLNTARYHPTHFECTVPSLDDFADMIYKVHTSPDVIDPVEESEHVLRTTLSQYPLGIDADASQELEAQQAQRELMQALMHWGLLQQHDLPILKMHMAANVEEEKVSSIPY